MPALLQLKVHEQNTRLTYTCVERKNVIRNVVIYSIRCVKRKRSMLFPLPNFVEYRQNDLPRKAHRKQEPTNCRHRRPISVAESDAIFYF